MIKLSPEIATALGAHPFDTLMVMHGDVFRQQGHRETLRIAIDDKPYFIKRYQREWLSPGAKSEWEALHLCEQWGVSVPALKGFGARGMQSFVLMEALVDAESLENAQLTFSEKRHVIPSLAKIARTLHQHGYYHRDFYLCHFFLHKLSNKVTLIDLHRLFKPILFKKHYQEKDLSGLLFSALDMPITLRDVYRFLMHYFNMPLRDVLKKYGTLLKSCEKKAIALYQKAYHRDPTHLPWLLARSQWPNQVGPFHCFFTMNEKIFESDTCLRVLGQRRMVLSGTYDEQRVVVKFFKHQRDYARECSGARLIGISFQEGKSAYRTVIYPYISGEPPTEMTPELLSAIADMHQRALIQTDPHLDNFRVSGNKIHILDPASIQLTHSHEKMWNNLALFYAQWPRSQDAVHVTLLPDYCRIRHVLWTPETVEKFMQRVTRIRAVNLKKWLSKTSRHSTLFYVKSRSSMRVCAKRSFANVYAQTLLRFPEAYFHSGVDFLKKGRSNTVVRVTIGMQDVVIKRYNLKSLLHFLKGLVRGSKAKRAWRNAHLCRSLGILTPEPLAMIEKRCCFVPLQSYLVTAYVPGIRLDHVPLEALTPGVCEQMALAIQEVFTLFESSRCYHGDLKASNWIWDGAHMQLIDLDSLKQIACAKRFTKYHQKDKKRFLQNFEVTHPLRAMLF